MHNAAMGPKATFGRNGIEHDILSSVSGGTGAFTLPSRSHDLQPHRRTTMKTKSANCDANASTDNNDLGRVSPLLRASGRRQRQRGLVFEPRERPYTASILYVVDPSFSFFFLSFPFFPFRLFFCSFVSSRSFLSFIPFHSLPSLISFRSSSFLSVFRLSRPFSFLLFFFFFCCRLMRPCTCHSLQLSLHRIQR